MLKRGLLLVLLLSVDLWLALDDGDEKTELSRLANAGRATEQAGRARYRLYRAVTLSTVVTYRHRAPDHCLITISRSLAHCHIRSRRC
jgi:hypothetical protein